jgi:hypothetical protein
VHPTDSGENPTDFGLVDQEIERTSHVIHIEVVPHVFAGAVNTTVVEKAHLHTDTNMSEPTKKEQQPQ